MGDVVPLLMGVVGLVILASAIFDFNGIVSKSFDERKDSPVGLGAVANSSLQFRVWVGLLGLILGAVGFLYVFAT